MALETLQYSQTAYILVWIREKYRLGARLRLGLPLTLKSYEIHHTSIIIDNETLWNRDKGLGPPWDQKSIQNRESHDQIVRIERSVTFLWSLTSPIQSCCFPVYTFLSPPINCLHLLYPIRMVCSESYTDTVLNINMHARCLTAERSASDCYCATFSSLLIRTRFPHCSFLSSSVWHCAYIMFLQHLHIHPPPLKSTTGQHDLFQNQGMQLSWLWIHIAEHLSSSHKTPYLARPKYHLFWSSYNHVLTCNNAQCIVINSTQKWNESESPYFYYTGPPTLGHLCAYIYWSLLS